MLSSPPQQVRVVYKCLLCSLLLAIAICTSSCHRQSLNDELLSNASKQMEAAPERGLAILKAVDCESLSSKQYAYYVLLQTRLLGVNGHNIASLEASVARALDYFTGRKDSPNAAFGCFVMAKVYEAKGETDKAQSYYLQADEWAEQADYHIPNFFYSAIPYHISLYSKKSGYFDTSIQYAHKTLAHVNDYLYDYPIMCTRWS